jgi:hypothetical protein
MTCTRILGFFHVSICFRVANQCAKHTSTMSKLLHDTRDRIDALPSWKLCSFSFQDPYAFYCHTGGDPSCAVAGVEAQAPRLRTTSTFPSSRKRPSITQRVPFPPSLFARSVSFDVMLAGKQIRQIFPRGTTVASTFSLPLAREVNFAQEARCERTIGRSVAYPPRVFSQAPRLNP